ncbi:hypothetical protein AUEXF2481DRAFT_26062 [Aureobasidium subglaciale EXF-2481]|uniref:Transcription factor RfeG n=1 Tax=Aureobasidium subglaciale (strain EXF-2481) TaxID=1043005 RepID=A0A074YXB1_AURSE|nr:uncharacterized protein AUEXF2481DRAFT_26062 [Aureobasidium subglaciale EXF-2481]KAI5203825.1 hypothetical protein E4T38_04961 [Aureobasidium subglaciale]KAI5222222.1 hypothetical protein E4T40_04999 [Aureobasidium subglaciale]KAI5226281.1 hypothetical protein E4T41_04818 [Aureobasidium subglaciale]KAI5262065.1 hypothetical protein E4T46_04711 [Aureobasidium subglaciale]KEQ98812.1 hypothetical protein AUEXF2481DRAFT_26062 [Aureobasidium subglaciale EXF-2481]
MATGAILRNWFVPKDGINRQVISADIQKYLGNDATVRPGKDKVNNKEIEGYWIKAYRNLTSEMINDLRMASTKWEQEQRSGRRGNYEDSHTYRQATNPGLNGNGPYRASTNSPQLDGPYSTPNGHVAHVPQRMAVPDMASYDDPRRMYAPPPPHSTAPVTTAFGDPSMYVSHQPRQAPNGYGPPGEFFNGHPGYAHDVAPPHMRGPPQYPPQYPTGHRDPRDDPRYAAEYQDQMRYPNYPPVSVAPNGGASSPQTTRSDPYLTMSAARGLTPPSNYPQPRMPQYDQYGRPYPPSTSMPEQPYRPSPVDPSYRERPSAPPGSDRGAPRRRIN